MEPSASSAVAMDTTTNPWENSNATCKLCVQSTLENLIYTSIKNFKIFISFIASPTPPTENSGGESWANFESATTNDSAKPATNSKDNEVKKHG